MSQAHRIQPTAPSRDWVVVRLGTVGNTFNYADVGKAVKLTGESQYDLCVAGDAIEAIVCKVEEATSGGYSIGAIDDGDRIWAIADGLQATPGTGAIAVGDYVLTGTVVARNTAFSDAAPFLKVTKATSQTPSPVYAWRVVSLGRVGTGAVGTQICIAPVGKKL